MKLRRVATLAAIGTVSSLMHPLTAPAAVTVPLTTVAAWPLSEGAGTTTADASGHNHPGTLVSRPTWTAGKVANALSFSGSSYVTVANIAEVSGATAVSLTAWIKRSAPNAMVLLGKQGGGHDLAIEAWSDGRVYFDLSSGSYADGYLTLNDAAWHHVALVFDGTATGNANRLRAYVDGTARTLTFEGTIPSKASTKSLPFYLGRLQGDYSNGVVDEVRVYTGALSAGDVVAVMGNGLPAPTPTVSLAATPTTVVTGGSTTLTWASTSATSCAAAGGWTGPRPPSGTEVVGNLTTTSTFTLTCAGATGSASANAAVNVTAPPPPDTTPPVRSAGLPSGQLPAGARQTTLSMATNEQATCRYDTVAGTPYSSMAGAFATTTGTSHSAAITGLADGGSYLFDVRCIDGAGNANPDDYAVAFSVANPVVTTGSIFPLSASADHRYLLDHNGRPFRIQGDAAWSMVANLTYAEADQYLTDRQARGFNTVVVNLLEHKFAVSAPANRRGDQPFTTTGNLSTPNELYFAYADSIIDLAASKGMAVMLTYLYLGNAGGDEGWAAELSGATNTQAVAFNYGLYLGSRYKNRPNIIWIAGGDCSVPAGSEMETREHKILEGIKAAGSTQLFTGHWSPDSVSTDQAAFAADMDLDSAYEYTVTYPDALAAYQHTPPRPALLFETGYEAEGWSPGDPTSVRAYEYDGELSAIGGTVYGHRDIWAFASDTWSAGYPFGSQRWQLSLGAPGAQDMTRMRALFDAVAWWNLVPAGTAGMRRLVTAGGGTNGTADYATAAAAPDGSTLVAYVPSTSAATRTVTVDLSVMSGPVRSRWYNPTSGAYVVISASSPNTAGSLFTTPGDNGTGARDWVLVIDRV